MRYFLCLTLLVFTFSINNAKALSCIFPELEEYDLIFKGRIKENVITGKSKSYGNNYDIDHAMKLEVKQVIRGNPDKLQKIVYTQSPHWGPSFPKKGVTWIYANCAKGSKTCSTGMCSHRGEPRFASSKIHYSACHENLEQFKSVVNENNIYSYYPSKKGMTVLTTAMSCDNYEIFQYLLTKYPKLADYPEELGFHPALKALKSYKYIKNPEKIEPIFDLVDMSKNYSVPQAYLKDIAYGACNKKKIFNLVEYADKCMSKKLANKLYEKAFKSEFGFKKDQENYFFEYALKRGEEHKILSDFERYNVQINKPNAKGYTALMSAILYQADVRLVRHLIKKGSDVNKVRTVRPYVIPCMKSKKRCSIRGKITPLELASRLVQVDPQYVNIVRLLLENGADSYWKKNGNCPVKLLGQFNYDVLKLLVDHGALVEQCHSSADIRKRLIENAAGYRKIKKVKLIVENLKGVKAKDLESAFFRAGMDGDLIEYLLKKGVNPNVKYATGAINKLNAVTMGPGAYKAEQLRIIKMLVNAGIEVNLQDKYQGRTPLHNAATYSAQIVKVLLEHGADKNIKDKRGKTPLDRAREINMRNKNKEIIELLRR